MNINKYPILKQAYELCGEIEKLPASEQQTKCSVLASAIGEKIEKLLDVNQTALKQAFDGLDHLMGDTDLDPMDESPEMRGCLMIWEAIDETTGTKADPNRKLTDEEKQFIEKAWIKYRDAQ